MNTYIIPFNKINLTRLPEVGGKNASLGEMYNKLQPLGIEGIGIMLGLVLGKPLGIILFSLLAYKMGVASLPENIKWVHILGVGLLGGIGFTMALFVASLAFKETGLINNTKISILFASVIAGLAGYFVLRKTLLPITAQIKKAII